MQHAAVQQICTLDYDKASQSWDESVSISFSIIQSDFSTLL